MGALTIARLLVVAPSLLQNLPTAALAAVVIAAALRKFDAASLRVFHRVRRSDFLERAAESDRTASNIGPG